MADLIERFLNGRSRYPQEWNDFVDSTQANPRMDVFRRRCYQLDPMINVPGMRDATAVEEVRAIVEELRSMG